MTTAVQAMDSNTAIDFALECFTFIPFSILHHIAWKIFLGPLTKHIPHALPHMLAASSKGAKDSRGSETKRVLHKLGIALGISIWIDDFKNSVAESHGILLSGRHKPFEV